MANCLVLYDGHPVSLWVSDSGLNQQVPDQTLWRCLHYTITNTTCGNILGHVLFPFLGSPPASVFKVLGVQRDLGETGEAWPEEHLHVPFR